MRYIFWTVGILLLAGIANVLFFAQLGLRDKLFRADIAVVFATDITPEGRARQIQRVVDLYNNGYTPRLLLAAPSVDPWFADLGGMALQLEQAGISPESILFDYQSRTAEEVALNVRDLARAQGLRTVLSIGEFQRLPRFNLALSQAGLREIGSVHTGRIRLSSLISLVGEISGYYNLILAPTQTAAVRPLDGALLNAQVLAGN